MRPRSRVCSAQIPSIIRVPVFWCFGVGVPMAELYDMADPERYNVLVTINRLVGVHPKLGDFRDS